MNTTLAIVMAVPLIIWGGVFAYLLRIDSALRRLERDETEQESL